jgi:hypothetical protein
MLMLVLVSQEGDAEMPLIAAKTSLQTQAGLISVRSPPRTQANQAYQSPRMKQSEHVF